MKKYIILFVFLQLFLNLKAQWIIQDSGTPNWLNSVNFINENIGYSVGMYGTVLKTVNGGNEWVTQVIDINSRLNTVFFINADTGYIGGADGIILKTIDGGNNWNIQNSNTTELILSIYFLNSNTGFATGYGTILKTIDGGENWVEQANGISSSITINAVHFINLQTGYLACNANKIYKTTNCGLDWILINNGITDGSILKSIYFINDTVGFVASNGTIWKTINAGNNWTVTDLESWGGINSIVFNNSDTGYAVGNIPEPDGRGVIYKTTDAGNSWTLQEIISNKLSSICFCNTTNYAVGDFGHIRKLSNTTEIANKKTFKLNIFPNPIINSLNILSNDKYLGEGFYIFDVTGRKIYSNIINERTMQIDFSQFHSGMYILQIDNKENEIYKLIKK